MTSSVSNRVENTVGKGKNADYPPFSLFLSMFSKAFSSGSLKLGLYVRRLSHHSTQENNHSQRNYHPCRLALFYFLWYLWYHLG